jgi:single-stranded-DNA-specific exonuclease
MAAGFTVETAKLEVLKSRLEEVAQRQLDEEKLTKKLKIDCELSLKDISLELYQEIRKLEPFGLGNPEPIFVSRGVKVVEARTVGSEGKHLKLSLTSHLSPITIEAIGFGMGQLFPQLPTEKPIEIAYSLALDQWNGTYKIQLKLKDIKWEKD